MSGRRRKPPRQKDLTDQLLDGDPETDRLETHQRFSNRSRDAQQNKIERTALLRAAEGEQSADVERLPIGEVIQVFSLYCQVDHPTGRRLCVVRKTLNKLSNTAVIVGDRVRFRDTEQRDEIGRQEAVIEEALPRRTILTRADSFSGREQHPIVANADQMLIVASFLRPRVKWGLVDRMIVAAQSGGLVPLVCLNKIDLAVQGEESESQYAESLEVLDHYQTLGLTTFRLSADRPTDKDQLKSALAGKTTVLAGHSGVGKSTLISAIQPGLDIRIGDVSNFNDKGRHTTSSARRYSLDGGGFVIDTPGVKMFGLWQVTPENLRIFFPDVEDGSAPKWRVESFERIESSL
jgi:ribosome biogenesis GTPase / thiamine phosphate phosphatase